MKKDDLVKVIPAIVKQELKRELPIALASVFQNLMGAIPAAQKSPEPVKPTSPSNDITLDSEVDETSDLKSQLREMFTHGAPVQRVSSQQAPAPAPSTDHDSVRTPRSPGRPRRARPCA